MKPPVKVKLATAALELFEERGYENTTVDDIAERAGVGRTTFFRAFGSKEDVIFPHHEQLQVAVRSRLAAGTPQTAALTVVEAARLVLVHYLDEGDVARVRYRLTSTVPALRQREIAGMQAYQRLFREFIDGWLAGQENAALRAELIAAVVVTAHNYVLRQWLRGLTDHPEDDFEVAMQEVVAMLADRSRPTADRTPSVVVFRTDRDLDTILPTLRLMIGESSPASPATPTA